MSVIPCETNRSPSTYTTYVASHTHSLTHRSMSIFMIWTKDSGGYAFTAPRTLCNSFTTCTTAGVTSARVHGNTSGHERMHRPCECARHRRPTALSCLMRKFFSRKCRLSVLSVRTSHLCAWQPHRQACEHAASSSPVSRQREPCLPGPPSCRDVSSRPD